MANQELQDYVANERAKGKDNDSIHHALVANGWDTIVAHRAVYDIKDEAVKPKEKAVHNTSSVMLAIGLVIVLAAMVVFIGGHWSTLNPTAIFLFVAVPNLILYAMVLGLKGKEGVDHIIDGLTGASLLVLPATIGVFLHQFHVIPSVDYDLATIATTVTLPIYIYHLFVNKKAYAQTLVLVNTIASFFFLVSSSSLPAWGQSLLVAVNAFALLATAIYSRKNFSNKNLVLLETASVLLFCFSIPSFFSDVASKIFGSNSYEIIAFSASVLGGGSLLAIAGLFGKMFMPVSRLEYWQQRFLIIFSLIVIFFSLLGANGDVTTYALLSIAIATVVTLIGSVTGIKTLYYGGVIGGAFNLITILFGNVSQITVLILLLAIGFAAIFISIIFAVRKKAKLGTGAFDEEAFNHWGYMSDTELEKLPANTDWSNTSPFTITMRIILVIVGLWAFYLVIATIFNLAVSPAYTNVSPTNTTFLLDRA